MTPTLVPHDAIGNDVLGMAESLRKRGYKVETYAEFVHPALAGAAHKLDMGAHSFWRDRQMLLIYHHSTGWVNGQSILNHARCHVVIKYHNVTPPRFFKPYSAEYVTACEAGQLATDAVALTPDAIFWSDSQFNNQDLIERGVDPNRCRVLAPFHCVDRLAESPLACDVIHSCNQHSGLKLLFVGGLKPNKGHARLIQALAACNSHAGLNAVLLLPGVATRNLQIMRQHCVSLLRNLAWNPKSYSWGLLTTRNCDHITFAPTCSFA